MSTSKLSNTITTEAVIEHSKTNSNGKKRTLENKSDDLSSKKLCIHKIATPKKKSLQNGSAKDNTSFDDVIINETVVLATDLKTNEKNTLFENEYRKKLNKLSMKYGDLIDTTKIKKEDQNHKKPDIICVFNVQEESKEKNDESDNDSEVLFLGPAPPKPVDIITLNENGEEISDLNKKGKESIEYVVENEEKEEDDEKEEDQVNEVELKREIEEVPAQVEPLCPYPKKWSKEMLDFYTKPVNVQEVKNNIQNELKKTQPHNWRIDYHYSYRYMDSQYSYNKFCDNCGMHTHDERNCPKPCFNVCPMCGNSGHSPVNCPEAMCLNCGKKLNEYLFACIDCDEKMALRVKCESCNKLFHSSNLCPHLWRCMEFTTKKGKVNIVPIDQQSNNTRYCSNCAEKGHYIEDCPHLSVDHPIRQDNVARIIMSAYVNNTISYKIKVNEQLTSVLLSTQGLEMLQKLSTESQIKVDFCVGDENIITYISNPAQSLHIKNELKMFLFGSKG